MKKYLIILLLFSFCNFIQAQLVPCKVPSTTTHDSISKRDSTWTARIIKKKDSTCGWVCNFWCKRGLAKPKWVCKYTWDTTYRTFTKKVDTIFTVTHDSLIDGWCESVAADCEYGVIVNGFTDNSVRASIAQTLGATWFRDGITLVDWRGFEPGHEKFKSLGFKTATNVCFKSQLNGIRPYAAAKDTALFASLCEKVFSKYNIQSPYRIDIAVFENEEPNSLYYTGPIEDYIMDLEILTRIAHKYGIKVTNGGLFTPPLTYLVYEWYHGLGKQADADYWWYNVMNDNERWFWKSASNQTFAQQLTIHRKLLNAYARIPIDYVNFHLYEPANDVGDGKQANPEVLKRITAYLQAVTGKEVINNELGQKNTDPGLVTSMLEAAKESGMKLIVWYAGDDPNGFGAKSLVNADGTLRQNGYAFMFFMNGIQ